MIIVAVGEVFFWLERAKGQLDGLSAQQTNEAPTELTTWPVAPKDRGKGGKRRRLSRSRQRGFNGPKHSADLPWFACCGRFLTLCSKRTGTAMRNASAIDDTYRTIALRSALMNEKRMARWAA
jgi:hypothetical protein